MPKKPAKPLLKRNLRSKENREFWKMIDECAKAVARWPKWKKGRLYLDR